MTIDMTEILSRSRVSLNTTVRNALRAGRTVRSRNRDGEYAIVLTDDRAVTEAARGCQFDGIADECADWTIAITDFTFHNVMNADAKGESDLCFWAPVFDRAGIRIGTIAVNGSPYGKSTTDQGPVETAIAFFSGLRKDDLFREAETNSIGQPLLFRATDDADSDGRVTAVAVGNGRKRVFELGPDYLAFKVI